MATYHKEEKGNKEEDSSTLIPRLTEAPGSLTLCCGPKYTLSTLLSPRETKHVSLSHPGTHRKG